MAAHEAAMQGETAPALEIAASRTRPGTLNDLLVKFYKSKFPGLEPITQSTYHGILEAWRAKDGDNPVAMLERRHIEKRIAEKAGTPAAQRSYLRMVRMVLAFAVDTGIRTDNPALGIKLRSKKTDGYHTWTEDEITAYEARHPIGTKARLAMALMLYTSGRLGDAVVLGRQHIKNGTLTYTQDKNRNRDPVTLAVPVHPELQKVIDGTPTDHLTFIVTEYGKPFTKAGFGGWMRDRCNEAGLPQCSSHGLRKACSRRLAEAGCSANVITAVTGHRDLRMVEVYTKAADQARMAKDGVAAVVQSFPSAETRTRIGKPG
jgi:integrase